MANYTTNLNLEKPLQSEGYDVDVFNANADKIDTFAGQIPPRALTADTLTVGRKINNVLFKGDTDITLPVATNSVAGTVKPDGNSIIVDENGVITATIGTNLANKDLSNLTTTGNNRLHALKGYSDEGELLTDAEGLADIFNYAHSTFDETNFTVVGSPTITDGVASGFSSENYLTKAISIASSSTQKIQIKLTTGALTPNNFAFQLIKTEGTEYIDIAVINGVLRCRAAVSSNSINNTYTIQANTTYFVEIYYQSGAYYSRLSTDGQTWTSQTMGNLNAVKFDNIYIGNNTASSLDWLGTIDLKYVSIQIDGVTVLSGNITGTDTYTIGGNTTTIPYTLSKTGSKIVDSYYRQSVADVYALQGYAPYYTLSDSDFTLPQGEIYGMMLNQSIPHIILCYENGASGYIVYSNGYCRQWGRTDMSAVYAGSTKTIYLLKEMSSQYTPSNPYFILNSVYASAHSNEDSPSFIVPSSIASDSFKLLKAGGQTGSEFWEVSGYLKDGEY